MTSFRKGWFLVAAVVVLGGAGRSAGQDEFPIGAWFPGMLDGDDPEWAVRLDMVKAAGFNTIHAARVGMDSQTATFNQEWMDMAHTRELKVQLHSWSQPTHWRMHSHNYWARTFEAEDGDLFSYHTGEEVTDIGADGEERVVRRAQVQVGEEMDSPGLLLDTDGTHDRFALRENEHARFGRHVFWLKTDVNNGSDLIATLRVLRQSDGAVLGSREVFPINFMAAGKYQDFEIHWPIPVGSRSFRVRYQVDWTGEGNLWVDKIRAHDNDSYQQSVLLFRKFHDTDIRDSLASYYGGTVDPPWRFFLYDEPRWEVFESVAYVDALIKEYTNDIPGVSAFNQRDRGTMDRYVDTVSPSELLVDFYPIHIDMPLPGETTYPDSLRATLNRDLEAYGHAREVAQVARIPLWAVVQVHNWSNLRSPTEEEIRVQVNLALAHGATGIYYFMYHSYVENLNLTVNGLVDLNFQGTDRLTEVAALNDMLQEVDDTLLQLTSNAVFSGDSPAEFVHAVSVSANYDPSDIHLGVFTHTDGSRYLMVVNKRCETADTFATTVTLDAAELNSSTPPYLVQDVYSKEIVVTNGGASPSFSVELAPGAGKLFRIEPWEDPVTLTGNVTIPAGVTLTLAQGATVMFDPDDETGGGNDPERSALIVEGTLDADAGGITFRSTNEPSNATDNDWYGIRVEDGGTVHLSGATIRDGYRCVQAHAMDIPDMTNATLDNCGVKVNLSPSVPVVGQLLTAALEGTEGSVADEQWRWQWRTGADQIAWANLAPAASGQTTSYLPEIIDFDRMLRATVWYRNAANTYDHAQSAPTAGVVPTTPAKPAGFEVLSLDGAVLLRWEDLNDPSITHWQYGVQRGSDPYVWVSLPAADALHNRAGRGEPGSGAGMIEYRIPHLENGVAYRFKLRAENSAGLGAETEALGATPGAVPSSPSSLSALPGDGQVELGWADPEDSSILRYEVRYRLAPLDQAPWGPGGFTEIAGSGPLTTRHAVEGLTNGRAYDVEVRAVNAVGAGDSSRVSATPGVPLPPALATEVGNGRVSLLYRLVSANGSPVTAIHFRLYRLEAASGDTAWYFGSGFWLPEPVDPSGSSYDRLFTHGKRAGYQGLRNGEEYTFEARVQNGVGSSPVARIRATPSSTPAPILLPAPGLRVTAGDGEVTLEWSYTGPASVSRWGYRQQAEDERWSAWRALGGTGTGGLHRVEELTNGIEYTFEVRGYLGTTAGASASASATPRTAGTPAPRGPEAPGDPRALGRDGAVALRWTTPLDNGSAITGYEVRQSTDGGSMWVPDWTAVEGSDAATTSHTVSGLTNGVEYTFEVRAVNGVGPGAAARMSATPADVPDPPGNLRAEAGDAQVALRWETPSDNGSAITGYEVRYSSNGGSTWVPDWSPIEGSGPTTRSHTVVGLTNEVEYTLEVRALNEVGPGGGAQASATPGGVVLSALGRDGAVLLSWVYTGSATVTGWEVRQSTDGGSSWSAWGSISGSDGATRSYEVGNLTNGVRYTFQVRGITGVDPVGSNPASATPGGVVLSALGRDGAVLLSWVYTGSATVTGWEVRQSTDGGSSWSAWGSISGSDGATRSYEVGNLTNGVRYTFQVRGITGVDPVGSNLASATPAGVTLSALRGDGRVTLDWSVPDHAIYNWQYRQSTNGGNAWSGWTAMSGAGVKRSYVVGSLTNGVEYTFQVRAVDSAGSELLVSNAATVTPADVPDPPEHLEASAGDAQVALRWETPSNNGAEIMGYDYRQSTNGGSMWSDWTSIAGSGRETTTYTKGSLTNGTRYTFAVRALNEVGPGGGAQVSATPSGVVLSALGRDGAVLLSWVYTGSASVTGWEVRQSTDGGSSWSAWTSIGNSDGDRRSYPVTGLTNGVRYTFAVRGITGVDPVGSNLASATPSGVTLSALRGDGQVTLDWSVPDHAIYTWQYRQSTNGGNAWSGWTAMPGAGLKRSYVVGNLTNGVEYTFEVRAVDGQGAELLVSNAATVTPADVPDPPEHLEASAGDRRVVLRWETPSNNGAAITGYEVRYSSNGGMVWSPAWSSIEGSGPTTRSHTVVGLTNEVEYTLEVRALNEVGPGGGAQASATPGVDPLPVLSATGGDGVVLLSWVYTGSASVTGWEVRQSTDGGSSWSAWTAIGDSDGDRRSYPVTGLTNGVRYTFAVRGITGVDPVVSNAASATPAGVTLSALRGDGRVTLDWSVPDHAIYTWQYRQSTDGGNAWSGWTAMPNAGVKRSYVVGSLTNGVEYTFQVRAVDSQEAELLVSNAATVTPADVPDPPENLRASAGDAQVALRWETPSNNGAEIMGYDYRQSTNGGSTWSEWTAIAGSGRETTTYTKGSLTNGTRYTFAVRALNEVGPGGGAQVSATPLPRAELSASRGDGRATLDWSVPGTVIYAWQYRQSTNGGSSWSGWTAMPNAGVKRSYVVRSLTNGTAYTFEVRAVDGEESGGPLSNAVTVTPAGRPGRPGNLQGVGGPERVALSWTASSSNGAAITGYEVRRRVQGSSTWSPDWTAIEGSGRETTSHTEEDLSAGTTYVFEVRARNDAGAGSAAGASATTDPSGGELTASRGDGRATLSWSVASTVLYDWEYRQSTNGGSSWSGWTSMPHAGVKRSYVVTNLTNGVAYTFQVRALNSAGAAGPLSNAETVTPAGRPGQPEDLEAAAGDRRVALSWEAAAANGADITAYGVRWRGGGAWSGWATLGSSARSHTLGSLTNGVEHTFEVRAENEVGWGTAASVSARPEEPLPPAARLSAYRGDGRATLSWSVTSHVVYDWEYRRSTNGGSSWSGWASMPHAGVKRSYEVRGLTNGTTYTFQIRALNSAGAAGPLSNAETVTPAGRPGRPENLRAEAGDRRVALSWAAAASNGADITAYGVRWRGGGAWSGWATLGSSARSHTLGSLTNGVEHTFEVRAENEVGWGTAASVSARPEEPLPPAARLSAYRGDGRATLDWSVASTVLYDWEYRRSTNGGSSWSGWTSMPYAGVKRSYEVRGLTNGTTYTFQIRALNSAGAAGPLSNRETVTPAGRPGRPENLRASAGDRRVALSWAAAAANGADITAYGVRWRGGGAWSGWATLGSSARSHTLGSLTNGVEHTFEVRATNEVGWGTAASVSARPEEPLPPAARLSAYRGDGRATLDWSVASTVLYDWEYRRSTNGGSSWSGWASMPYAGVKRSYEVRGLTNGVAYTFQIRALNSAGAAGPLSNRETVTPAGRPGRPENLQGSAGDRRVALSWAAAAANGADITAYGVRWRGGGAWSSWTTLGSSARSYTKESLSNGVEYAFEVRATNEVGWGTAASVSARPEAPLPAKPTGLSATGGDSRVSLRWDNPHNSTITEWQYRRKAGSGSWGSSRTISGSGAGTTSYAVTGLLDLTRYTFQVRAKNAAGEGPWSDEASAQTTLPFRRSSNHPNPFNAETLLRYAVPEAQRVRLTIYDMLGRAVRELVHEVRPAGVHEVVWDGRDGRGRAVASGVYLYRLQTPESSHTRKMILLR